MIASAAPAAHISRMPSRERVDAFVAMITRGEFLESIPAFYTEDLTAQENSEPPRLGREAQIANEERALSAMHFEESRAVSVLVDGDRVAIHWKFRMKTADGVVREMEEIAYQQWREGRIAHERYFYDPAQMKSARR